MNTPADEAKALIEGYLEAMTAQNVEGCVECYADDATLAFMSGIFSGRQAIEEWHRARFEAGLELVQLADVRAQGDTVTVDATVTSKRLQQWKIGKLSGRAIFRVAQGKIKETKFSPRVSNPFEGWGTTG